VFNPATKTRVKRMRLVRPGSSISLSHGPEPLMWSRPASGSTCRAPGRQPGAQPGAARVSKSHADRAGALTMGSLSGGTAGVLAAQLAAFVAVLLAVSAGHKVVKWSYSRNVVREFAGLPHHVATAALAAAALGEAVAGVLLLLPGAHLRMIGASLAAAIWAAYLVFILRAVLQGRREVDCGCSFGSGAGANQPAAGGVSDRKKRRAAGSGDSGGGIGARRSAGARVSNCWGLRAAGLIRRIGSSDGLGPNAQRRSVMSFLIASQIALWVGLLVLGVICIALARQIGVLHQRIAPAGALSLRQPLNSAI